MYIAGFSKSSLINYPKHASAVVFIGGCNFRCGYCHNPEIVFSRGRFIDPSEILSFLNKRKRFLDGVCITGGEPTLADGLSSFIKDVKEIGYDVKLDTNGSRPEILKMLIANRLLDYVAMDIKAPIEHYNKIANADVSAEDIEESIDILMKGHINYEFRTTVCRNTICDEDINSIAKRIKGAALYYIQNYKKAGTDSKLMSLEAKGERGQDMPAVFSPCSRQQLEKFRHIALQYIDEVGIR